jgi:hypothetical protein
MQIHILKHDPDENSLMLSDIQIDENIKNIVKILATAHRVLDGEKYKDGEKWKYRLGDSRDYEIPQASHVRNKFSVWVRKAVENYNMLTDHLYSLLYEYMGRHGKKHELMGNVSFILGSPPFNLKNWEGTKFPS